MEKQKSLINCFGTYVSETDIVCKECHKNIKDECKKETNKNGFKNGVQ